MEEPAETEDAVAQDCNSRDVDSARMKSENTLERITTIRILGKLKMRGKTDDLPQSWWFASTAIPLTAATIGPLANVLSIAALVTKWIEVLPNNGELPDGADEKGVGVDDPRWELIINAISLACGFFGNFALLCNFTKRVRYIVALPLTIIFWFLATGLLISIIVGMHVYVPPVPPGETWSQGYWYAVMATVLYMIGGAMLMINMLGYFLGKYPQHFDLDDDQRTLILQTMMFFFWLAGGAAIFSKVCGWAYADALYFCDVTVLTIGFGDFTSTSDAGRGIVFPYSVIGIIFLGLMISSIRKFAISMSKDKISRAHEMNERARTFGRSVTSEKELRDRLGLPPRSSTEPRKLSSVQKPPLVGLKPRTSLEQYGHLEMHGRSLIFHEHHQAPIWVSGRGGAARTFNHSSKGKALSRDEKLKARKDANTPRQRRASRRQKLLLLTKEKDRFNAMRDIQHHTHKFRQYYALAMSTLAFSILWCVGALVFMFAERREQNLTYFESLYFCYVSLLTIGYGDFSPRSNAGKSFFVVWSLIAIPTMTILVSDMGETVVSAINRGTFTLADVTVMPKVGIWHDFLENHPAIKAWLAEKNQQFEERKRLKHGFTVADPDLESNTIANSSLEANKITIEDLAKESLNEHDLARKLAKAIKRVAQDIHADVPVKYRYEEWVEFTRLIRFSAKSEMEVEMEEEEGLIEWDWIGEDSPMLSDAGEPQWILDRLCESLNRYTRRQAIKMKEDSSISSDVRHRTRHHDFSGPRGASPDPQEEDEASSSGGGYSRNNTGENANSSDAPSSAIRNSSSSALSSGRDGSGHGK